MIEPTESESKAELDRFIDAMVAIREEIREVEEGRCAPADSILRGAPHPVGLLFEPWRRAYDKRRAFLARPWVLEDKYWPPVARVDNVHGDRHLVLRLPEDMGARSD